MTGFTAWCCAVCGRCWVEGPDHRVLQASAECDHAAEVRLPPWLPDEADALRWLARQVDVLKRGSLTRPGARTAPEDPCAR